MLATGDVERAVRADGRDARDGLAGFLVVVELHSLGDDGRGERFVELRAFCGAKASCASS